MDPDGRRVVEIFVHLFFFDLGLDEKNGHYRLVDQIYLLVVDLLDDSLVDRFYVHFCLVCLDLVDKNDVRRSSENFLWEIGLDDKIFGFERNDR